MEDLREVMSGKSDRELYNILENKDHYVPLFVEAAKQELVKRTRTQIGKPESDSQFEKDGGPSISLSDDDRRRIYEEEKFRLEAQQAIKNKQNSQGCILAGVILVAVLLFMGKGGCPSQSPVGSTAVAVPSMAVAAGTLWTEYDANEIAADQKYKGKSIAVSGSVDSIGTDILASPYVTLQTSNMFESIHCTFDKANESSLSRLSKGQYVTIIGICKGSSLGSVMLDHCRLSY